MPIPYGFTKKAKLAGWLRSQSIPLTRSQIHSLFTHETGIEISMSSISAALTEWKANNDVHEVDGVYLWKIRNDGQ